MQNSDNTQSARTVEIVDANHVETLHRPGPKARDRTREQRSDARMRFKLAYALDHRFAETHCYQRRVLVHKVVAELANDVGIGTRKKLNLHGRGFRALCSTTIWSVSAL